MPLKTFWMLHKNIDRIAAAEDYRSFQTMLSVTSSEGAKDHSERLTKIIGVVADVEPDKEAVLDAQPDLAGIAELKAMAAQGQNVANPR